MRRGIGIVCMVLGAALMVSALALFLWNREQSLEAGNLAAEDLPQILEEIQSARESGTRPSEVPNTPVELLKPEDLVMTEKVIDGVTYIGYLVIPKLELELSVQSGWTYPDLQRSPCRFLGSARGEDLVLIAHNYPKHFGRLSDLREGDSVRFTDMDGKVWDYEVVAKDILDPDAVEELTAGNFDLTLCTCTYGGSSRITIYCDLIKE